MIFFSIILGVEANYYQFNISEHTKVYTDSRSLNIPDTLRLVSIMVQFPIENPDNPKTSGNGRFLNLGHQQYINFYNSEISRCDGFLVDRPPHNSKYFQKQLEAVGNYYNNVSHGNLPFTETIILNSNSEDGYYTVENSMESYAKSDQLLAQFFTDALKLANLDIQNYFTDKQFTPDDVVFVVFHAGLSQDFSYPSLDPTIYDLKSAYIDETMMGNINPESINQDEILYEIFNGILLPETQNIIYYDVVEDIFGNPDYNMYDLCDIQIGLTGIFAFLLGYHLGLPEMFDPKTGEPGIGFFGLMDHGSNNGRGVIPSPPSPWTRSLPNSAWSNINNVSPFLNTEYNYKLQSINLANEVIKINLSGNEYFLIENRNNWIENNIDIDSLRSKNKRYDNYSTDSLMGHWFDVVTNEEEKFVQNSLIEIDDETKVITSFDHYDYGLPGSGILIWHIKEPDISYYAEGINSNLNVKHVQIEEADGAQDIGTKSFAFFSSDDPTKGTRWDLWFAGNSGYKHANPNMNEKVIFNHLSSPSTHTVEGAESFVSFEILSEISNEMEINIKFHEDIEIINLIDSPIKYLGNSVKNNIGYIYYAKDDSIYKHSYELGYINIDKYNPDEVSLILSCCNNTDIDTIITTNNQYAWIDTSNGQVKINENYINPRGYLNHFDILDSAPNNLISSDSSIAFGDLDKDGLDEIIKINNGNIIAKNSNGTLLNGFPVIGNFKGVPLIANILPSQNGLNNLGNPEIICREGDHIIILSYNGERLRKFSSYDTTQPLAMVPFWRGDSSIALVDGSRLFLFDQDLEGNYWLNARGKPSGFPSSTGLNLNIVQNFRKKAYNYPNPVVENMTTFRFYVNNLEINEIQIKIFNASGYLIKDDLVFNNITYYEFNEIKWDNIQLDVGLYFVEIKPNVGPSELIKMVILK